MLLTNGLLLRKQAREVIDSVDEVIVSLDGGTAATYEAIRGVDGFDLILEGIRDIRAGGIPVTTRTTVQRANFREIPQIITAAKNVDVNHISFLTVDVSNEFAFGPRFQADTTLQIANMGPGAPPEHGPEASALTPDDVVEVDGWSNRRKNCGGCSPISTRLTGMVILPHRAAMPPTPARLSRLMAVCAPVTSSRLTAGSNQTNSVRPSIKSQPRRCAVPTAAVSGQNVSAVSVHSIKGHALYCGYNLGLILKFGMLVLWVCPVVQAHKV